ncbi:hypothetical protein [Salinivibrio socompensis]|uniref:hypothetical protein n=1 Tax=Salinivibrio socompensis TaxID=1510206 RepID=UPI0004721B8E|nr:hypothetical protein [Salinivibrio socompensis]
MGKKWDQLKNVGDDAVLKENTTTPEKRTRSKHLKNIPAAFFERHETLYSQGKTTLDFSNFIYEAIREKLEKEESQNG